MNNVIILLKGHALLTKGEYNKGFHKGDTIWGAGSNPVELMRWNIEQREDAWEELVFHNCIYRGNSETWSIEEYALKYCECDEEGDIVQYTGYDLAPERVIETTTCDVEVDAALLSDLKDAYLAYVKRMFFGAEIDFNHPLSDRALLIYYYEKNAALLQF